MGEHLKKFGSIEEEARFWARTGLERLSSEELEETSVDRPQAPLSTTFAVRFDQGTVELLRRVARVQGLGPTQLVRAWVLERLRLEREAGALATPTSQFPTDFELTLRKKILDSLLASIPLAVEEAMQEVLSRADREIEGLRNSL